MSNKLPKAMLWASAAMLGTLPLAGWGLGSLSALPYGSGTYGTCQYSSCSITISTGGTTSLGVVPTASGVYSTASDSVSISTNASTGYTLSFTDSDTNTALVSGANSLSASTGTPASPITLALNTWGYRVDGLAGFGAGPTSAQNSVSSSTYTFAGVPASNVTAHTLRTATSAADPAEITTVWYGTRVDTSKPSGAYTGQVTYTGVTND